MPGNRTGKNRCAYPKITTAGYCGKTCDAHYCSMHIKIERLGLPLPPRCPKCGLFFRRRKRDKDMCQHCDKHYFKESDYEIIIERCLNPFPLYDLFLLRLGAMFDTECLASVVGEVKRAEWEQEDVPEYSMVFHVKTRYELAVNAYAVRLLDQFEPRRILPHYHYHLNSSSSTSDNE